MDDQRKETFYRNYHSPDKMEPGISLDITRSLEFNSWRADLSQLPELVKLSPEELTAKRKSSSEAEQAIFKKIQAAVQEWEEQAAQTLVLDRALEYVHTPEVAHTSNEWKPAKDGTWEISNQTYIMRFKIWEDTEKPGTFLVSWAIGVNCPVRPKTEKYYYSGNPILTEQNRKRYETHDAAQRYIQGRFDLYAHLFTELRPPIPNGYQRMFTINGCLLPGYTVAPPERAEPDEDRVNALLDCLENEPDGTELPQEAAQPVSPQAATTPETAAPPPPKSVRQGTKKANRKKARSAPVR